MTTRTFPILFQQLTNRFGKRPFFIDERHELSVARTYDLSRSVAKQLYEIGLRPGDTLLFSATRSLQTAILVYACLLLGLAAFPLDVHERICFDAIPVEAKALCYPSDNDDVWTIKTKESTAELAFICVEGELPRLEINPEADALYIRTSGSEGKPKIVRHSQSTLINHFNRIREDTSCDEKDSLGVLIPFSHIFGLTLILLALFVGYACFFPPSLDSDDILDYFIAHKITYLDSVPSHLYALALRAKQRGLLTPDIRAGLTAGAPMDRDRFLFIEETFGMKLLPTYGMSEIPGISSIDASADMEIRRCSVGKPLPGNEVLIVDEDDNPMPPGKEGEIIVRSDSLMKGYYDEPSPFDEKGFFHTGDLGRFDAQGFLYVTGRKKLILIRNGNNISMAEIEGRVLALPKVLDCCCVALPDASAGEAPGLMVLSKEGDEEEIRASLEQFLPKIMRPTTLLFVNVLPRLPSGKVDRAAVRRTLCSKMER